VTWTVTDLAGNTATCAQSVTVTDDEDPTITCPNDVTVFNDLGDCFTDSTNVSLGNPTTGDNCGVATVTNNAPLTFPVGITTVTWIVTDIHGNTASCTQDVTVVDNEDPVLTSCAPPVSVTANPGVCEATGVTLGTPTVVDNCGIATVTNDAPAFYPVGVTTVTWTITDANGNIITCSQEVTVTDDEDPTITCPAPVTVTADAGLCEATGVALGTPTTSDNCTVASVVSDAPASFPVGITTVTWTVTDLAGNTATCAQSVTVTDDEDPTITCPNDVTVFNDLGDCFTDSTNVSLGNPTTGDNCGVATVTNNAPLTFPVGITTVTWIVTDIHGNTASCTQDVTVVDNEDPVLTSCAPPVSVTANPGVCEATGVTLGTPTVVDNCGIATVTNDAPAFYPVGITTVTWTITDANGNIITCTQEVTVTDDEDPTITCPAPVTVSADAGLCEATGVNLGTPTTSDNCTVASVVSDAPASFLVGATTVTWTVTDLAGNTATCTQSVTVTDDEDPTITCPNDVTVFNDLGDCFTDSANVSLGNPTIGDNCGVATVTNNAPLTFPVGTTTVTWIVTDIHGNTASCTQDVTVVDNEDPVLTSCAPPVSVTANPGVCEATGVTLGTPTVVDNCGIATVTNDAPAFYPVGITTVTWTITDANGNIITCTQEVTVTDDEDPTITCPVDISVTADNGVCFATNVSLSTPITSDNCNVSTVLSDAPATFPVGLTTVTWTVTDSAGNIATCSQEVTVTDDEDPTITCPADVTVYNDSSNCFTDSANVSLGMPVVVDNCGIDSIINNAPVIFPVGNTNVTWTIYDIHGNSSVCVQVVTVIDNEVPVIDSCAPPIVITADANLCGSASVSLGTPWVNDNCGIATVTDDAPAFFPVGSTTVTWTIIDIHGNSTTCAQDVTVTDDEDPTITCPSTLITVADSSKCFATNVNLGTPIVADNCAVATVTNDAPSIFPVDTTIVTWVVTDIYGNTDTCYQNVIIEDAEAPLLVNCPADTSSCDSVIFYPIPTASDNCGILSIAQVSGYGPGATFPVGVTTEVWEITDVHGNISFCSFDITIHPQPLPSLTATDISCYGFDDGLINNNMLNGTAPYSYIWSNGDTTQHLDSLTVGQYTVVVTDVFGCMGEATIGISQPDSLEALETHTNVSCNGVGDGGIDLTVFGGTSPYGYSWNNGSNAQDLVAISGGNYNATITDFNGCTIQMDVIVEEPDSLLASGTVIDAVCLGANGGIDISITGGVSPYQYLWSNGDTLQDLDSASAGIYSVTITDTNGCSVTYQDTIESFSIMTINGILINPLCYGDSNGTIEVVVVDGTAPYTFSWNTGDTTQIITDVPVGNYIVTITDANGCGEIVEYIITQPDSLNLDLVGSIYLGGHGVSGYQLEDGEIDLTVYGGTQPINIVWSTGSTDEDLYNLPAGFYTANVTDANGCTVIDTIRLTQPYLLEMPTGYTPNEDGSNDYFVVKGIEVFPDNELLVYNRWGNLVYSQVGYQNEWNGANNSGDELPDGTYFVILKINTSEEIILTGYVDLRRTR